MTPRLTVTCLDSSAIIRLCTGEGDLAPVERAMAGVPVVSTVAAVEVPAAIFARFHRGMMPEEERERLFGIGGRILDGTSQVGLTAAVRQEALAICRRFLLRTMDAIHLGTAMVVERQVRRHGGMLRFCTADLRQAQAAAALFGSARTEVLPPLEER
ncbi:MAG: PIN domain-containing protein [Thermaerobacter sp.]|nr:PIN domain-containing protein [Thermaerobacter sp.]